MSFDLIEVKDILGAVGVVLNLGGVVAIGAVISIFASLGWVLTSCLLLYILLINVPSEVLGYFCCCLFSVTATVGLDLKAAISVLLGGDILGVMARLNISILKIALGLRL